MGSHIFLALQFPGRPRSNDGAAFLAGAIAPDVRYVQADLPRERTHSWEVGSALAGPFGAGYRHHLAVDQAFYRRCEQDPFLRRLGAMNAAILAELYAIRQLSNGADLAVPAEAGPLQEIGVKPESLAYFVNLSATYVTDRDPEQAIHLLTGSMRDRAKRYLDRWHKWGPTLKRVAWLGSPYFARLFRQIRLEAENTLEERSR